MSTIIIATTGEYSDYSVDGVFDIKKPFKLGEIQKKVEAAYVKKHNWDTPQPKDMIDYMVREGYLEIADYEEIHFGSYSDIEFENPEKEWK